MDYFLKTLSFIWQNPELRFVLCLVSAMFIGGIWVSCWSSSLPAGSLYQAGPSACARRLSFKQLKHELQAEPDAWLLYENEIYYVPQPELLSEVETAILQRARARFEDGGKYAKHIGMRVFLKSRRDGRKYLRAWTNM